MTIHSRRHVRFVASLMCAAAITGCSEPFAQGKFVANAAIIADEVAEAREAAIDAHGWQHVTAGFSYRDHPGGVGFMVTPPLLTRAGLREIETILTVLALEARTDVEHSRINHWQQALDQARDRFSEIDTAPEEARAYLLERLHDTTSPAAAGSAVRLATDGCVAASAMPTSASPGAKSYATASCSGGGPGAGYVRTETNARAATNWPTPCSHQGWNNSQCNSTAYGSYNCFSGATAAQYAEWGGIVYQIRHASDTNELCTT